MALMTDIIKHNSRQSQCDCISPLLGTDVIIPKIRVGATHQVGTMMIKKCHWVAFKLENGSMTIFDSLGGT
jgi:hypothetical protein